MAALVAALWAYDGWNDLNMVAGEVKNPERNIPIALIAGVATVGLLYVLVNAGVQYVLPASAIAASPRPASDAVGSGHGAHGREHRVCGHGDLDAGHAEWHNYERRARAFCRGSRWIFLLGAGRCASALSHAVGCYRVPGCAVDRSFAAGRKLPATFFARHLCGMALLYDRGQHHICFPPGAIRKRRGLIACSAIRSSRRCSFLWPPCCSATPSGETGRIPSMGCWSSWLGFRCSRGSGAAGLLFDYRVPPSPL